MLRLIVGVARTACIAGKKISVNIPPNVVTSHQKTYITLNSQFQSLQPSIANCNISFAPVTSSQLLSAVQPRLLNLLQPQIRTVTKFSIRKGKRKTVKAAVKRFFRLSWGGWIRTRAGRFKHLWRKSAYQKYRYKQHVFCNATQCTLLDKMVTKYWKRRRYYVDDPYEPYHTREEYPITRKKPLPPPPH
ncbi:39S ribosomal protein L35, mitochondrial [Zootermopsis nevadensis]|uniref:Large ribosomal subunit protein bL35m n=1 Tax=Zootermopsis nevadensis TaxID=136037 RepID=A0A067QU15_ZOONE|nr:39S ribosomal protein L35, mitochondrial [Zootermopsis nevadensis]KDR13530.1 39S ribosomal protein L35, mitochondrial [Zootermopsis nevadensis]